MFSDRLEANMNSPAFVQKREHPRVPVSWPVTMVTPEGDIDGVIENISAGGAYIRCGTPLLQEDLFILSIRSQDREHSWIGAEVVWIDIPLSADSDAIPIGMGVRFTNVTAEDLQFLSNVVSELS
jgi:hypothetical protein